MMSLRMLSIQTIDELFNCQSKEFTFRAKHKRTKTSLAFLHKRYTVRGYRTMQNWNKWSVNIKRSVKVTQRSDSVGGTVPTLLPGRPGNRGSLPAGARGFSPPKGPDL